MKIMLVHNYYQQPGGEDVVFSAESSMLRNHGHQVVEYTDDNHRIDGMGHLVVASETVWSQSSQRRLRDVLTSEQPDMAHFHNTFPIISISTSTPKAANGTGRRNTEFMVVILIINT